MDERVNKLRLMGFFDGDISDSNNGGGDMPSVIDNLTSASTTDALSANQGRVLNEQQTNLYNDLDARVSKKSLCYTGNGTPVGNATDIHTTAGEYDIYFDMSSGEIWQYIGGQWTFSGKFGGQ